MAAKITNMTKKPANTGRRTQKTSKVVKKQIVKKQTVKKQVAEKPKNPNDDILPRRIRLVFKEDIKPKKIRLLVRDPVPPKERIVIRIPAKYLIKTEDEKL
jgi:hypothetical protein